MVRTRLNSEKCVGGDLVSTEILTARLSTDHFLDFERNRDHAVHRLGPLISEKSSSKNSARRERPLKCKSFNHSRVSSKKCLRSLLSCHMAQLLNQCASSSAATDTREVPGLPSRR